MSDFISKYIDLMALVLTILIPAIITFQLKRKKGKKLRAIAVYLNMFGPSGILVFIFFHLFENSYRAIDALIKGAFKYDFRFYSLLLLGVVIGYLGIQFLYACYAKCLQKEQANRYYFKQVFLILLFTLPLIPIIPIAAVPFICCVFSLSGFFFVNRKIRPTSVSIQEENFALTA